MHPSHQLRRISRLAGGLLVLFAVATGTRGQSLPATPPTALPGPGAPQTPGTPQTPTPAPDPPRHAEVIITHGLLQIRADNSSLNQILRSISHITGMKITGGVEEQRVFGSYGPATLSTILATLLDGTGANILLLGGNEGTPPELVLTSRTGGPEPPGPNSPAYAMYDDRSYHAHRVAPAATPPEGASSPAPAPAVSATAPATAVPPPAGAPAKPLTPEMVMQELLQMQAQQDQKNKSKQPRNSRRKSASAASPQAQIPSRFVGFQRLLAAGAYARAGCLAAPRGRFGVHAEGRETWCGR